MFPGNGGHRGVIPQCGGGGVDDDALLNTAVAEANKMTDRLLKDLEQRWQSAHDLCMAA